MTKELTGYDKPPVEDLHQELQIVMAVARASIVARLEESNDKWVEEGASVELAERSAAQDWVCAADDLAVRIGRFSTAIPEVIRRYRKPEQKGKAIDSDYEQTLFSRYLVKYMQPFFEADQHEEACAQSVADFIAANNPLSNADFLDLVLHSEIPFKVSLMEGLARRKVVTPAFCSGYLGRRDHQIELGCVRALQVMDRGPGTEKATDAVLRMVDRTLTDVAPNLRGRVRESRKIVTRGGAEISTLTPGDIALLADHVKKDILSKMAQQPSDEEPEERRERESLVAQLRAMNFKSVSSFGEAFRFIAYGLEHGSYPSDPDSPVNYELHAERIALYLEAIKFLSMSLLDARSRKQHKTIGDYVLDSMARGQSPVQVTQKLNRKLGASE